MKCCEDCDHSYDEGESVEYIKCSKKRSFVTKKQEACNKFKSIEEVKELNNIETCKDCGYFASNVVNELLGRCTESGSFKTTKASICGNFIPIESIPLENSSITEDETNDKNCCNCDYDKSECDALLHDMETYKCDKWTNEISADEENKIEIKSEPAAEIMVPNIESGFDYSSLDAETSDFLKAKVNTISEISKQALTDIGKALKEAQDKLAKKGYGCFEAWYTSLGYKKDNVYGLINRYNLIVGNPDKQNLIESLPKSLAEEIAKPSANQEAIEQVFNGDITTNKQYQMLLASLNKANEKLDEKVQEVKRFFSEKCAVESKLRTTDQVFRESQKTVESLENLLRNTREKLENKEVLNNDLVKRLIEAKESGNVEGVKRLQATLDDQADMLKNLQDEKAELENQLNAKPIETTAVKEVAVIPYTVKRSVYNKIFTAINCIGELADDEIDIYLSTTPNSDLVIGTIEDAIRNLEVFVMELKAR